ncbi:MAG: RlmE family RNA methyltransferase [Myxococcaceae bacterium]|nr:RlmE family RNA methyltransferase [Myxococcaceae bacterium]MBH2005759.1 RlmE family RNA methyltransferase [Myxococcaceae bacterium]
MAKYNRKDPYYHAAKKQGFVARSIFKLEEIDRDFRLIRPGTRVLDLGCSPGSWLQYAERVVGDTGSIVGIDLAPLALSFGSHVQFIQGDIFEVSLEGVFDLVLSDMAPKTSGIKSMDQDRSLALCEEALQIATRVLKPGGRFCVKVLEGGGLPDYVQQCRQHFKEVKIRRPQGTRPRSMETYVIGISFLESSAPRFV